MGHGAGDGMGQDLHQIDWRPHVGQRCSHHFYRGVGAGPTTRRGGYDDGIGALDGHHGLIDRCGRWVGRRRYGRDNSNRFAVLTDAALGVVIDDAYRAHPHQISQGAKGLALVLYNLVVDIADSGIGDCELRQMLRVFWFVKRPGQRGHQLVHPALVGSGNLLHRHTTS